MRRLLSMPSIVLVVLVIAGAAACGGKVDEPAGSSAPAAGANAPQSTTSGDGCERACDRMAECTSTAGERSSCVSSCGRDLGDATAALAFATCLEALSCADIERGLSMDYGPIGECFARAHRR
jgi:hypothetical protein